MAWGGLFRDSTGAWLGGYAVKGGEGSVLLAELNGVHHHGLHLAWRLGNKKVQVEVIVWRWWT